MNRKIRILFVLEATLGGIRKHVIDLLLGVDREIFSVGFAYSSERADPTFVSSLRALKECGVILFEIPMKRKINPFHDVRSIVRMIRVILLFRPDIVHVHGAKAGGVGRIACLLFPKVHVIYTPHGGAWHKFNDRGDNFYSLVEKSLVRRRHHFIGVSKASCRQIAAKLKTDSRNIHLVHNGISVDTTSRPSPSHSSLSAKGRGSGLCILYPAVFLEAKGHVEFMTMLVKEQHRLDPDVRFKLAGDGPIRKRIESIVAKGGLGKRVEILGFCSEMQTLYEESDLVLLPSRAEAFPYALLEALSFGKPIFATDVGGIPEVVRDGYNGELFSCDHLGTLIDRFNYYSIHRTELAQLGANGLEMLRSDFLLSKMIANTQAVYLAVMSDA